MILNVNDDNFHNFTFALESNLRILANLKGSYVVALLDCCREILPEENSRGGDSIQNNVTSNNLIISFGCPPAASVP